MDGRRAAGGGMLVAGAALVVLSIAQLAGGQPGGAVAARSGAPVPGASASAGPAVSGAVTATASPGPASASPATTSAGSSLSSPSRATPTPDSAVAVRALLADLAAAIRAATPASMIPRLHPAVLDRYGLDACQASLGASRGDPTYAIEVISVGLPGPWDYVTDGRSTRIPDAWSVEATVTMNGLASSQTLHVAPAGGTIAWFTDCGVPR